MPRKESAPVDAKLIFEFTPKQLELSLAKAPKRLAVGGVRSGKTTSAFMYGVFRYMLRFRKCDMLVLRRTFRELEAGAISDLRNFCKIYDDTSRKSHDIFHWNDQKKIATFHETGSRVIFGSCTHNKERDIEQYLGQGYPFILLDECAQFSPDAWETLIARNTVNVGCEPLADGTLPSPVIWGCTNPIGPYWIYYKTLFVDRKPVDIEGAKRDPDGRWFVMEAGERRCVYEPSEYAVVHSTVLDNPAILKRDPGIIARLNALPPAKRDKFLFGLLDRVEGQYFDNFAPEYHVVNLREDPDAILWQAHQPVWLGWDWGMGHANCIYFFTKALVRKPGGDYKLKTVCFNEVVTSQKDQTAVLEMMLMKCHYPGRSELLKLNAIYFSHEKFNRVMEQHSPADVLSGLLRAKHQPPVSPATRDRIASASFVYNQLQIGDLVILDHCTEIIQALPALQRDPNNLDDVLKVDNKYDDCYDAFRYGLFGQLGARQKSVEIQRQERVEAIKDPFVRRMTQWKNTFDREAELTPARNPWEAHLRYPDGSKVS